jgi:periplasmic protein TonB
MPNYNTSRVNRSSRDVSSLGILRLPARQSRIAALASDLRDFLLEHPAQLKGGGAELFADAGFGAGVGENLKEFFKTGRHGKAGIGLMSCWDSGFAGFRQNLRDLFSAPKLPADGERVPEIWSKNPQFTRVKSLSVAIHVVALALIIGPMMGEFAAPSVTKPREAPVAINLSRYNLVAPPAKKNGTGGGGQHDNAPVGHGQLPQFQKMQLAAPKAHPLVNRELAVTPALLGDSSITPPNIAATMWGNPLSNLLSDSMGRGNGNGLGDGNGDGAGGGDKYGYGKDGVPAGTRGYGNPACLYCPNAQFSDEAVKAKYQGVVLVAAVITPDGRATNVRVVKGLGLGLDENAVAAVRTWRFRPATGPDGKPAAVLQTIEVEFRLI